jgi:hypothetical protein
VVRWGAFEGVSDTGEPGQADTDRGIGAVYEGIWDTGARRIRLKYEVRGTKYEKRYEVRKEGRSMR